MIEWHISVVELSPSTTVALVGLVHVQLVLILSPAASWIGSNDSTAW